MTHGWRPGSPVHYTENSTNGAYWSVVGHELIKQVDIDYRSGVASTVEGIAWAMMMTASLRKVLSG